MDPRAELEEKRREMREEILAVKDSILPARIVNFLGSTFQRGTAGYWLSNLTILNLILFGPWMILGSLLKETGKNALILMPSIIAIEFSIFGFTLGYLIVQNILSDIANSVVQKINNIDNFLRFMYWLRASWSHKNVFAFILPFTAIWAGLGIGGMSLPFHEFVGFGLSLTVILVGLIAGMAFYFPFWVGFLALRLKDFQYELNAISPADSEIVHHLSEILIKRIYMFALFFCVLTFISTSNLVYEQLRISFSIPFILLAWTGITLQFIITRLTVTTIAEKAKWKTLNRLQTKINFIGAHGDLSDQGTAEKFLRLTDIHARVSGSATNMFDLKSILMFVTQLMLPLLGLLLGNLDKIRKLFP
jgi:hypothetical protein